MDEPSILLTNDDGIESTGLRALYDALSEVADVTVVAPAADKSAVGRSISQSVGVHDHEMGYGIEGTPADCVVAGIGTLLEDVDLVVAGCNRGGNLGAYVLGRSGTVSAAVEATFFDVPAIAVSMVIPTKDDVNWSEVTTTRESYSEAARATRYLADHAVDAGVFEEADYLNVNAIDAHVFESVDYLDVEMPNRDHCEMTITHPSETYRMDAERAGGEITLYDRIWEYMAAEDVPEPAGTDVRAIVDGRISVSPLTAPHTTERHGALDALAETYPTTGS